jgi:hypothetical protein
MEYWKLVLEYVKVLVWPSVLTVLAVAFRREIRMLLRDRDVQVEALGANIALTRASAEADAAIDQRMNVVTPEVSDTTAGAADSSSTASTARTPDATDDYAKLAGQALAALSDEVRPVHPVGRTRGGSTGENQTLVRAWDQLAGDAMVLMSVFPSISQHVNPFMPLSGETGEPRWREIGRSWDSLRRGLGEFAYVEPTPPFLATIRVGSPPAEASVVSMYLSSQHLVRERIRTLLREAASTGTG